MSWTNSSISPAGGGERYRAAPRPGKLLARERIELLARPGHPVPRAGPAGRVGDRLHRRRQPGGRHRGGRGGRVRGHRQRPDRPRRRHQPVHAAQGRCARWTSPARTGCRRSTWSSRAGPTCPRQAEIFIPGGRGVPRPDPAVGGRASRPSRWSSATPPPAAPTCPGMSDYIVMVEGRAKVFLGGPPLVKMATGEESDDEELGGADDARPGARAWPTTWPPTSTTPSASGRDIVARLNWRKHGPGPVGAGRRAAATTPTSCSASPRPTCASPSTRARCWPGSSTARASTSSSPCTGRAWSPAGRRIHGYPIGVLANHRGVLFSEEAQKATQFIQLANQTDTPLLFLQNTTGYMVGKRVRAGRHHQGRRQDDQRRVQLARSRTSPSMIGARYGAGQLRHVRPGLRPPLPLHLAQRPARGDGSRAAGRRAVDRRPPERPRPRGGRSTRRPTPSMRGHGRGADRGASRLPLFVTGRLYDDGIIDPRDTRTVLGHRACRPSTAARSPGRAASACSGCDGRDPVIRKLPRRQPGRDRPAHHAQPPTPWASRPWRSTPTPTRDAPTWPRPTRRSACPGRRRPTPTSTPTRSWRAARRAGADAVHPGYGFLSEDAGFARACADGRARLRGPAARGRSRPWAPSWRPRPRWPPPGSRCCAERRSSTGDGARPAGTLEPPRRRAARVPVLVKASAGGGGRGMRLVRATPASSPRPSPRRAREAAAAFGDGTVFLERYVAEPRHVEVQILGDTHGNVVHLFERECSIQRRHQKIIEEARPPPSTPELRAALADAAVAAAGRVGYVGAGTVEFLLVPTGRFYFLEVNTRLQVEHPVTELVTGLDLVRLQLLRGRGPAAAARGRATPPISGHAIEARLYAEDATAGFLPAQPARCTASRSRSAAGVRVDSGVERRHRGQPALRPDAGQGDRARPHPRPRRPGALARALRPARAPRGDDQPRPAGARSCATPSSWPATSTPASSTATTRPSWARPAGDGRAPARHAAGRRAGRPGRSAAPAPRCSAALPSGWRNVPSAAAAPTASPTAAGDQSTSATAFDRDRPVHRRRRRRRAASRRRRSRRRGTARRASVSRWTARAAALPGAPRRRQPRASTAPTGRRRPDRGAALPAAGEHSWPPGRCVAPLPGPWSAWSGRGRRHGRRRATRCVVHRGHEDGARRCAARGAGTVHRGPRAPRASRSRRADLLVVGGRPGRRRARRTAGRAPVAVLRIANCTGFFGDRAGAATRDASRADPIDVLTGDYLAELTMLILCEVPRARPAPGYARTFLPPDGGRPRHLPRPGHQGRGQRRRPQSRRPGGSACASWPAQLGLDVRVAHVEGDDLLGRAGRAAGGRATPSPTSTPASPWPTPAPSW